MKKILLSLTLLSGALFTNAQNINTVAGNNTGLSGYGGDGGPATAAYLYEPVDLAFDTSGDLFISDKMNNCIREVNKAGIINTVAGNGAVGYYGDGGPATAAEFSSPTGMSVNKSGEIYIVDCLNFRIRKVDKAGNVSTIAGNGIDGNSGDGGPATSAEIHAGGVYVDTSGAFYIADCGYNIIRKVNKLGIISTIAGNGTTGYSGDGGPATAAELNTPSIVTFDPSGNMYICDFGNNCIRKVNTLGIITTVAGNGIIGYSGDGGPATAAEISNPTGLSLDAAGNIYIGDLGNSCVRMVNTIGIISTIAGNEVSGYSGDGGPATAAEFNDPAAVVPDALGNIFIADYDNNAVREISKGTFLGVNNNSFMQGVSLYPNPNNGVFTIEVKSEELRVKSTVEIYNMLGEKIYSKLLTINNGQLTIDLSKETSGVYLYRLVGEAGEAIADGKFVIE